MSLRSPLRTLSLSSLGATLPALLLPIPPAAATIIDDFEAGYFCNAMTGSTTVVWTQPILPPGHCIASERIVQAFVSSAPEAITACMSVQTADDVLQVTFPAAGGRVTPIWTFGDWDLTQSGAHSHILVRMRGSGPAGGTVELSLADQSGWSYGSSLPNTGPGIYAFPFSDFPAVDIQHVKFIAVGIAASQAGQWELEHVETGITPVNPVWWDIVQDVIDICPSCPPEPVEWDWAIQTVPPDPILPGWSLTVDVVAPGYQAMQVRGFDSGGLRAPSGPVGMMDLTWTTSTPFTEGTFTMDVEVGSSAAHTPQLSGPPGLQWSPEGIGLTVPIVYLDRVGGIQGSTVQTMLLNAANAQELRFDRVTVTENPVAAGVTPGFRLTFDAIASVVDESEPLIDVHMYGNFAPGTTPTGVPSPATVAAGAALHAVPTVMRTSTRLELGRPAERDTSVRIFDVAGRLLRTLLIPAGASGTRWNALDESGRPVAAGVYFAHHRDSRGGAATARVIRLR